MLRTFIAICFAVLLSYSPAAVAGTRAVYIDKAGNETAPPPVPVLPTSAGESLPVPTEVQKSFTDGRAWFACGKLYGYIDESQQIVITPQFEEAREFFDGLAVCKLPGSGRVGIDRDGRVKSVYVDQKGALAFGLSDVPYSADPEDLRVLCINQEEKRKYGYIDKTGQIVIPANFDEAEPFHNGLAAVKKEGVWSYIDKTGQAPFKLPVGAGLISNFSEGLAAISIGGTLQKRFIKRDCFLNAKLEFIDTSGRVIIPPKFYCPSNIDSASFSQGLAAVPIAKNGFLVWGYIDKSGKYVLKPRFKSALPFQDGRASVALGLFGFDTEDWQDSCHGMYCSRERMFDELLHEKHLIGME